MRILHKASSSRLPPAQFVGLVILLAILNSVVLLDAFLLRPVGLYQYLGLPVLLDRSYLPRLEVLPGLVLGHLFRVIAFFDLLDYFVLAPHEDLGEQLETARLRYLLFLVKVLNGD